MVPSSAMRLLIHPPLSVTNMNTHLKYKKIVSIQTSLIINLKITTDKKILADKNLSTHEKLLNF